MKTVIFGSEGNVGRRLREIFPDNFRIDRAGGADLVGEISSLDFEAEPLKTRIAGADVVLHLATSPKVDDPDDVQYQAVVDAARLVMACQKVPVPRLLLPSSDWADPKRGWPPINVYGYSKRMFEGLAEMYRYSTGMRCAALRIGWVARDYAQVEAAGEDWLRNNYWDDARLFYEVRKALDLL